MRSRTPAESGPPPVASHSRAHVSRIRERSATPPLSMPRSDRSEARSGSSRDAGSAGIPAGRGQAWPPAYRAGKRRKICPGSRLRRAWRKGEFWPRGRLRSPSCNVSLLSLVRQVVYGATGPGLQSRPGVRRRGRVNVREEAVGTPVRPKTNLGCRASRRKRLRFSRTRPTRFFRPCARRVATVDARWRITQGVLLHRLWSSLRRPAAGAQIVRLLRVPLPEPPQESLRPIVRRPPSAPG